MNNDDFQDKILNHLAKLTQDMAEMRLEMNGMQKNMVEMRHEMTEMTGMQSAITEIRNDMSGMRQDMNKLIKRVDNIETQLEDNISPKITILFDGWQQYTDQLYRIEEKVSSHEEFIIKRIK